MPTAEPEPISNTAGLSGFSTFLALVAPALALWYFYFRMSRRHMLELAEKLPGPSGYPLIGNALEWIGTSDSIFSNVMKHTTEFSQIMRFWIGPKLLIFLMDPQDVEVILSSHVYITKAEEYRFFKPWMGNGILISNGSEWKLHRKLIARTFHLSVLKSFIEKFNTNSRAVVEKFRKEGSKEFDCHDYIGESAVDTLLETLMGVPKSTQGSTSHEYIIAVMKMCDILHLRHTRFWLRPDWLFNLTKYGKDQIQLLNIIKSLTKNVMQRKNEDFKAGKRNFIQTIESKETQEAKTEGMSFGQSPGLKDDLDADDNDVAEKKRLPFLDLLMEASQIDHVLTEQEVRDQIDTLMFEGHDTVGAGSSFFLSMMGCHPEIQEDVIQELDEIFGDSDRPCTFQDTLEMKCLERCLMETLRLYPPVPFIGRKIDADLKLASGDYTAPGGSSVLVSTIMMHRSPKIYPEPDKFNPDNFLPENTKNRHYYAFVPFSAGPRSCVGRKYAMLKMKILLSTILRNFRVRSKTKESDFRLQGDIILKRAEGFKVCLESRK